MDISQGSDGTLWATDSNGVPHFFSDELDAWTLFGWGIDAIAYDTNGDQMVFRGQEYLRSGRSLSTIAEAWPKLPYSFRMGVDGAANVAGTVYLFKGGRYVNTDEPADALALNTLSKWPTAEAWAEGLVEAFGSQKTGSNPATLSPLVLMFVGDEYLIADMKTKAVVQAPRAVSNDFGALAAELAGGFDGLTIDTTSGVRTVDAYQGMKHWVYEPQGHPQLPDPEAFEWQSDWQPTLAHAPSGRVGALWAVSTDVPNLYHHDGNDWELRDFTPAGRPASISVGSDGLLHVLTSENSVHRLEDSGSWTKLAKASMALTQIAVGDANSVFVRDEKGAVHRLEAGAFVAVDTGAQATDMSVSADGALWHAHRDVPEAYRKVTDAAQKSEALSVGGSISGLRSITTTGFGSAYMLADKDGGTQVLSVKSAILMKTPGNYATGYADQMAIGSGCLFVSMYTGGDTGTAHACIDAHTGLERWRVTLPGQIDPNAPKLPESVYDPVYHLIYLAMGSDIAALDVHTGNVVWRYTTNHGALTARPTLAGNLLCFVTDAQAVFAFDTAVANAAMRQEEKVSPLWVFAPEPQPGNNYAQPPLIAGGMVIASTWNLRPVGRERVKTLIVTALRTGAGLTDTQRVVWIKDIAAAPGRYNDDFGRLAQPVFCPAVTIHPTGKSPIEPMQGDALVVGWDHSIHLVAMQDGRLLGEYEIPEDPSRSITSGVTIWPGQPQEFTGLNVQWTMPICVFGTSSGTLYAIAMGPLNDATETQSKPTWNTPFQATTKSGNIRTTPFLRSLNENLPIIHYGLTTDTALYSYDPGTGEAATQGTGATVVTTLAPAGNGVVYAGGSAPDPTQVAQYFAIRLDDAIFLDFLVESHLMEDYDGNEKDTTHHTRYQTHVTMLDATKAPRPNQAVKIWSDEPTKLQVDGVFHDVGPMTPVHFQTDGTGSFTLVSEAESTRTSPLRVHADFMDDHERIIIYPDREFHGRLAEAQADPDGAEDDLNDPQRVNLSTAKDYSGAHLCKPKTQQAEHTRTAVVETTAAAGLGALGTPLGQLKTRPEQGLGKYIAYDTTPGVASLKTNTPAYLLTDIKKTTGFVLGQDDVTVVSAVEAAAAVDALEGEEVDPGSLGAVEVGGFFKNLWHFIHSLGDKIGKIAVSIGKAVYAGIQYVEKGIKKVIRVVIRTISDIASLIGGFFVKLGKLIKNIVEALTILFHLKQIINTAKTLRALFKEVDKDVAGLVTQGKKVIDKYFEEFETTIDTTFEKLIEGLDDGMDSTVGDAVGGGISGIRGMGSTTHTAFTVGPKDKSHPPKSHATQCTWGAHKVRHQYKNSNQIPSNGLSADAPDPFTEFVTNFLNALENDPELKTAINQAHAQLNSGFKAGSAKDFLESSVKDFLELFKVIIISAVAVVKALLDAIMDSLAESIQALGGLKIPILSPLWKAITGEDLTFLDIVTFVLAIPVTIIYRIVEKAWPPQYPEGGELQLRDLEAGTWGRVFGLAGGVAFILGGLLTAINDIIFISGANVSRNNKILKGITGVLLLFAMVFKSVWAAAKNRTDDNVILAITAAASALSAVGGGVSLKNKEDTRTLASTMSVVGVMIGIISFWPIIALFVDKKTDVLQFAASFTATLPALINPLKLLDKETLLPAIVPTVDMAGRGAAGALTIAETIITWDE